MNLRDGNLCVCLILSCLFCILNKFLFKVSEALWDRNWDLNKNLILNSVFLLLDFPCHSSFYVTEANRYSNNVSSFQINHYVSKSVCRMDLLLMICVYVITWRWFLSFTSHLFSPQADTLKQTLMMSLRGEQAGQKPRQESIISPTHSCCDISWSHKTLLTFPEE